MEKRKKIENPRDLKDGREVRRISKMIRVGWYSWNWSLKEDLFGGRIPRKPTLDELDRGEPDTEE